MPGRAIVVLLLLATACRQPAREVPPPPQAAAAPIPAPAPPPIVPPPPVPDPMKYPVWGIDVSHYQGRIDWKTVASAEHIRFAYIKATEGASSVDKQFSGNWRKARAAGLQVGAYHYFSFCSPGQKQAEHFLSIL